MSQISARKGVFWLTLVRLAAADGDEDAVGVAGVFYIRPPQGGDFRPPQSAHEEQPGDHGVLAPPRGRHRLRVAAVADFPKALLGSCAYRYEAGRDLVRIRAEFAAWASSSSRREGKL